VLALLFSIWIHLFGHLQEGDVVAPKLGDITIDLACAGFRWSQQRCCNSQYSCFITLEELNALIGTI